MIFIQIETMEDIRSLLVSINQMHAKELSNSFENFSSSPPRFFYTPFTDIFALARCFGFYKPKFRNVENI
jgi:hypothetical protein